MKRIYEGWLSRDASGELYFGQKKPIDDGGIWNNTIIDKKSMV